MRSFLKFCYCAVHICLLKGCDRNFYFLFCLFSFCTFKVGTLMGKDVFNDDLKLHFYNQSEIPTEDNTIRGRH